MTRRLLNDNHAAAKDGQVVLHGAAVFQVFASLDVDQTSTLTKGAIHMFAYHALDPSSTHDDLNNARFVLDDSHSSTPTCGKAHRNQSHIHPCILPRLAFFHHWHMRYEGI